MSRCRSSPKVREVFSSFAAFRSQFLNDLLCEMFIEHQGLSTFGEAVFFLVTTCQDPLSFTKLYPIEPKMLYNFCGPRQLPSMEYWGVSARNQSTYEVPQIDRVKTFATEISYFLFKASLDT